MMVMVSYVVTLFNKEQFLPFVLSALASQQGPFEKEFIFVDDGSTDGTLEALRARCAGWTRTRIVTQPNAGPALATNRGFAMATGDFIKPVDGDDMLAPLATAAHLNAMEKGQVGVTFARGLSAYDPQRCTPQAVLDSFETQLPDFLYIEQPLLQSIRRSTINTTGWMARRDVIERIGPCDPAIFIQDYSIELKLAAQGPLCDVQGIVWAYPELAPGRLSDNQAQILHDVSLAAIRFARSAEGLSPYFRNMALRRAAKRAVSWKTRRGSGPALGLQWLYARSLLGLLEPTPEIEDALCAPFRESGKVRLGSASG